LPRRRRDDRKASFAEVVAAERRRPQARDGQATNRVTARELWDDQGRCYTLQREIEPAEAEQLISDPQVRLGMSWPGERRLEWYSAVNRDDMWVKRFRPRLQTFAAGVPDDGQVGYVPQLWSRADGSHLVLLQVLC
jgi:hypothetical protein